MGVRDYQHFDSFPETGPFELLHRSASNERLKGITGLSNIFQIQACSLQCFFEKLRYRHYKLLGRFCPQPHWFQLFCIIAATPHPGDRNSFGYHETCGVVF